MSPPSSSLSPSPPAVPRRREGEEPPPPSREEERTPPLLPPKIGARGAPRRKTRVRLGRTAAVDPPPEHTPSHTQPPPHGIAAQPHRIPALTDKREPPVIAGRRN
jgi:hypothetical protein